MAAAPFVAQDLLRKVSRSFYLTIAILPGSIQKQIRLAYLLARASDTIADTRLIRAERRHEVLLKLRDRIRAACEGRASAPLEFGDLAQAREAISGEGTPAERALLGSIDKLLTALRDFDVEDRSRIRKLLDTITRGQETDLVRLRPAPGMIAAFETDGELDAYTYDVAGCVGEFWTEMCRAHVVSGAALDDPSLMERGVRFGKGLQLVNILRDIPKDLRRGRCYIPRERLSNQGLEPAGLLERSAMERFRPIYSAYLGQAEDHLAAGWQYTVAMPFRCVRVRLACAWPLLIGARTLRLLRFGNVLDDRKGMKISRTEIRRLLLRSALLYPNPAAWDRLFDIARKGRTGSGSPGRMGL